MRALKIHMDRAKSHLFVKRISDFHLLLFVAQFMDVGSDVLELTECVRLGSHFPEGYELLINLKASICQITSLYTPLYLCFFFPSGFMYKLLLSNMIN